MKKRESCGRGRWPSPPGRPVCPLPAVLGLVLFKGRCDQNGHKTLRQLPLLSGHSLSRAVVRHVTLAPSLIGTPVIAH